jgi:hypothetical protein
MTFILSNLRPGCMGEPFTLRRTTNERSASLYSLSYKTARENRIGRQAYHLGISMRTDTYK